MQQPFDLNALSHEELLASTRKLAETERRITVTILHHLAEIERRRSYAKLGYSSLWDYTVRDLKYSESAAFRRISAMRALKAHPELEQKISDGTLSVTTVSQVQTFIKAERDQASRHYSDQDKSLLFKKCENKSSREVTRELLQISPLAVRVQKERAITENRTMISFVADTDLLSKIHRVRDLAVPRLRDPASYPELVNLMSEVTLDEIDPMRRPNRSVTSAREKNSVREKIPVKITSSISDQTIAPISPQATQSVGQSSRQSPKPSRTVSAAVRAQIWREFDGRCAFVSRVTGNRCNSTFGLEIEHCKPHALGGSSDDPTNLRLLCRHHNQWQAIESYGLNKIEKHLQPKGHKQQKH